MDLFWTIVILIAVYYVFRFFARIAVPRIIKRTVEKTEERLRRDMAKQRGEEEIDIDEETRVRVNQKKGMPPDEASFTDYEEVD